MRRVMVGLVALWVASLALAQEPADKLVGYWPFEEAQGLEVRNASGQAAAGVILKEGRGVQRVPGWRGMGLKFDGGDPAQRGQAGGVHLRGLEQVDWSQGLTVEAWVRFDKLDRPSTYEIVSTTKEDRGPGWRLTLSWESLWLRSGEGGSGQTWGAASTPAATRLVIGQWYHLAGTYDGSIFRVYVDGARVGQSEPRLKLTPGEGVISVGSYHGGYAYGLDGVVDEVRLYTYARGAAEIMAAARLGE